MSGTELVRDAHPLKPAHPGNIAAIEGLEPKSLWSIFAAINERPRDSMKEQEALQAVKDWAEALGFEYDEDATGNLCVHVPAKNCPEGAPPIMVQNHIDMVCSRTEASTHDFTRDPIELVRDGDTMKAKDTSLGADNLLGLAAAMAVAEDPNAVHPEMHLLITKDEEGDFTGASNLDLRALKIAGVTTVLNLDTESQATLISASAGYIDFNATRPIEREALGERPGTFHELKLGGLAGGHSGLDTGKGRGNANLILVKIVERLSALGVEVLGLFGGEKATGLSAFAKADLFIPEGIEIAAAQGIIDQELAGLKSTLKDKEGNPNEGVSLTLTQLDEGVMRQQGAIRKDVKNAVFAVMNDVPDGVLGRSKAPETFDQVEDSINLGLMDLRAELATLLYCARSYDDAMTNAIFQGARDVLEDHDFTVTATGRGGSWVGNPNSRLSHTILDSFAAVDGQPGTIERVHGGLELEAIVRKVREVAGADTEVDTASFGTEILDQHNPAERVSVSKVAIFQKHLYEVLRRLSEPAAVPANA